MLGVWCLSLLFLPIPHSPFPIPHSPFPIPPYPQRGPRVPHSPFPIPPEIHNSC
ncbi:hypothetical protein FDUTEX481_03972 [Tolypothrix sp. PCC 7601]|nr:hypothetical protein FDUTEX481_03972 [Tolypothrix sp. PCC 7601]